LNSSVIKRGINRVQFQLGRLFILPVPVFRIRYDIVFFFLSYDLSGAPRVHLDLVSIFSGRRLLVVFLKKSKNEVLLKEFSSISEIFTIKYKILKHLYLGIIAGFLKRYSPSYIIGMGIPDFYLVIQKINHQKVKIIDINHAIITLHNIPDNLINNFYKRIVIDEATKKYLIDLYKFKGLPIDHISLISNKTEIPDYPVKEEKPKLFIIFVGRDTHEKRAHLIPFIAKGLENKIDYELLIIGKFNKAFKYEGNSNITFLGEISERAILNQYYRESDIILLVSSREGFPMVLMEAMAYGVVPVCTPAGGIPFHIKTGVNGFLINQVEESHIIETTIDIIIRLYNDRTLLRNVSINAYNYAKENFGAKRFNDEYKKLIKL